MGAFPGDLFWLCCCGRLFKAYIDRHINNSTALSVVGVLQYAFLPLALCQILKSVDYLKIYRRGLKL